MNRIIDIPFIFLFFVGALFICWTAALLSNKFIHIHVFFYVNLLFFYNCPFYGRDGIEFTLPFPITRAYHESILILSFIPANMKQHGLVVDSDMSMEYKENISSSQGNMDVFENSFKTNVKIL